jgi:hypothetical protein
MHSDGRSQTVPNLPNAAIRDDCGRRVTGDQIHRYRENCFLNIQSFIKLYSDQ